MHIMYYAVDITQISIIVIICNPAVVPPLHVILYLQCDVIIFFIFTITWRAGDMRTISNFPFLHFPRALYFVQTPPCTSYILTYARACTCNYSRLTYKRIIFTWIFFFSSFLCVVRFDRFRILL